VAKGKTEIEYLIPSGTNERTMLKTRPRGDAFGKAFARYRKALKVHDRADGRKKSRVDFHSFWRWFATKRERQAIRST
jgi:hypothetical protein